MNNNEIKNVEVKKENKKVVAIDHEELLVTDEEKVALIQKGFSDLSVEDLKKHQKFPAKVYQDEFKVGFGKTLEVKKIWKFAIKLAPSVVLSRTITEEELYCIQALNPKLISNKSVVEIPVKCISGVTEEGRRFFRIIACLCHSVYFGSSRKDYKNSGYLSNLQVTNLVINNRLVKSNPELKKIDFINVSLDQQKNIDKDYTEELINSNDNF